MRDWADIPIVVFVVLLAYFRVAPVGARNAGIILCCRRSEEAGLGGPWDDAAWATRCGGAC